MSVAQSIEKLISDHASQALSGDIVLIRADLNVPLNEHGEVRDATRLTRLLPSLKPCRKPVYGLVCCHISGARKAKETLR